MYSESSGPSSIYAKKREGFMKEIQNVSRENIKKKYRSEMIVQLNN